jgi:UDP-N-acetylmuramate dehydrogenase
VNPIEEAARLLGGRARRDAPLGALTTYRVGGRAALLVDAGSVAELADIGAAVRATGVAVLVVGRGSNLLVADRGFAGLAVVLGPFAQQLAIEGAHVTAGAGVLLPVLARQTAAAALSGLEWAVGVPGSVGGGVRMNAGGHGSDIAASLLRVRVIDLHTGEDKDVPAPALDLGFRRSNLADHHVVVDATFALAPGDRAGSEAEISAIVRWRRENQPGGQNAGSVFVNPVPFEVSAGRLIDELGLRGMRIGSASVSEKHANFIQADDGGRADDVRALMQAVRERVRAATGYALRSEIRLVGFEETG